MPCLRSESRSRLSLAETARPTRAAAAARRGGGNMCVSLFLCATRPDPTDRKVTKARLVGWLVGGWVDGWMDGC